MRELKKASSQWVHDKINIPRFAWQTGYGAFTVSPSSRDKVRQYISNQEEHHQQITFHDELIRFLEKSQVKYDPKYLD